MPLAYRSFFRVQDEPHLEELAVEQLHSWLRSKDWDADAILFGDVTDVAEGVVCAALLEEPKDGSRTLRHRFVQDTTHGTWITELTVHRDRSGADGWVWIDLENPAAGPPANAPRLARNLLEVLPGRDGSHLLGAGPRIVRVDEVGTLLDALEDADRRGHLFVAGTEPTLPLDKWTGYVDTLLKETVGLSASYVLDADATAEFNQLVPSSHRVEPGTVRTFQPDVDLNNPLESVRHRVLSTGRIVRDDVRALQRLLGRRACELSLTAALPKSIVRLDRRLRDQLDTNLFEKLTVADAEAPSVAPEPHEPTVPEPSEQGRTADDAAVLDEASRTALQNILGALLGTDEITAQSIIELGRRAADADRVTRATTSVRERIRTLETKSNAYEDEIATLRRRLEDEQQDRAIAETERVELDRQLRHVRGELARLADVDTRWEPEHADEDVRPGSFDELLDRFGELDGLVFTGDAAPTQCLDNHDPLGTWAGLCWDALLALRDYARLRASAGTVTSVTAYLADTPGHLHGFPPNKHARDESHDVQQNPKYRKPRILPVPACVATDRKIFMGAHFKIAQFGMISPRMHYFDDTSCSGKIYVGYIGAHLRTSKTN